MPAPTLGNAARLTPMLEFSCSRCDRSGRYHCATLLARFGPDAMMGDVIDAMAADCPRRAETQIYELCRVRCPTLARIW